MVVSLTFYTVVKKTVLPLEKKQWEMRQQALKKMLFPTSSLDRVLCSTKDHISVTVKELFLMLLNSSVLVQ